MPMKPNEILELPVFLNEAPFIQSISNAQLVYELCVVTKDWDISLHARTLDTAFGWVGSPQGYEFWAALCSEALRNRRHRNAQA